MKSDGRYTILRDRAGYKLCVMRPNDPQLAIKLSLEALEASKASIARGEGPLEASFDDIIKQCGGETFVGFYGQRGTLSAVVDIDGYRVGDLQPGDAFARWIEDELAPD